VVTGMNMMGTKVGKTMTGNVKPIVVHIPHSSTVIPDIFREDLKLNEEALRNELLCMTDWYTEELFSCEGCETVVHRYSRIVCDPERFLDPEEECMWQQGMGMYYTRASDGQRIKPSPLTSQNGLRHYGLALEIYQKHHETLRQAVDWQLEQYGSALVIDGHSFSSKRLPYEKAVITNREKEKGNLEKRPDICLGTDRFFTPEELLAEAMEYFTQKGLCVAVNTPFAGTMVPEPFYSQRDRRVRSLMIEVNRRLYMNEVTGEKNGDFAQIQEIIQGFLKRMQV